MHSNKLQRNLDNYKTYVFDCDGVLIDSNRVKTDAFYQVAIEYGKDVAEEFSTYHKDNGGISRQEKFKYLFCEILNYPELPQEAYDKALDEYARYVINGLTHCDVLPGVREFIEHLPEDSKKYVVSGGAEEEVRWVLKLKGLATFFDGIYGNPIDKMNLVLNLKLDDKDYPGIFFGDARYDYVVASKFELDFVFLSGVTEFSGWEKYIYERDLVTSKNFSDLIEKKNISLNDLNGNAYFFGFPFSPLRKSKFTGGLMIGPGIIKDFLEKTQSNITLFSSSAEFYQDWERVNPVNQKIAFWDSSLYGSSGLSYEEIANYQPYMSTLQEMVERNPLVRRRIFDLPSYQVFQQIRSMALSKFAFWNEQINKDKIKYYINSNVPHLADDFVCYCICQYKKIPTAFPYRMPIVPGVSARLYIPLSLYDHGQVYDSDGNLIKYNREVDYGEKLPNDLNIIYNRVVLGDDTLGTCSRKYLESSGKEKPEQFTPPDKGVNILNNISKNIIQKYSFFNFKYTFSARKISRKNKSSYKYFASNTLPEVPFVYYALHMQPEASSSPLGGALSDQLRAIRFLSDNLPKKWKLIVKEHPHQKLEERSIDFYEEINKSSNVELMDMSFSSDLLQEKSIAVATLTGTAALEAWLKGKPALVLGHILFQDAPGIYKIRSHEDATSAFNKISNGLLHSKKDIFHYMNFLGKATFFGHLDAYINPSMSEYEFNLEENEKEIAHRLNMAIFSQIKLNAISGS